MNATRIQIASDLHIEVEDTVPKASDLITPSAPVLILAGDIGRIRKKEQLETFLQDVCKDFEYVLYVMGNHEYYRVNGFPNKNMYQLMDDMIEIEASIPNLYILNRSSVVIGNTCIAGCTLWSQALVPFIPNFIVRIPGMDVKRYNDIHHGDVRYIESMVKYCNEKQLKLVVVTHHCPTYKVLGEKKAGDKYKSLYASNLDRLLVGERVHTWICGHNHCNFDFKTRCGTRLVSNQKGKPKDNVPDFSLSKVLEI